MAGQACIPFVAKVPPALAGSQGYDLSVCGYFGSSYRSWEEDLFDTSPGTPLAPMGLFTTAKNIYCFSQLKPNKIFRRIFF